MRTDKVIFYSYPFFLKFKTMNIPELWDSESLIFSVLLNEVKKAELSAIFLGIATKGLM